MCSTDTELTDECWFGVFFNDSLCGTLIIDEPGGCYLGSAIGMLLLQSLGTLSDVTSKNTKSSTGSTMMASGFSKTAAFGGEGLNEGWLWKEVPMILGFVLVTE